MKLTVSQAQLAHGLGVVSRAVSPRSTLPVLNNILIATDDGRLRISATNLELGITCWIGAQIEEEGSITIPARIFADLISTLPGDKVSLSLTARTQSLNIRSGTSNFDIKGIDAQEFPPMPVPDLSTGVELNVSDFKDMIRQVGFAASSDEARPVLQGVLMEINDNQMSLAATDGFRIAVRNAELSTSLSNPVKVIIPARSLGELARIATDGNESFTMVVPQDRGQVIFHMKDAELVTQLIEGNFPDYRAIIPRSFKTRTVISTAEFLKACRQAEIIARESNYVIRLNIQPQEGGPGTVEFSTQSEEMGSGEVVVDANIEGPELLVAFNVSYLSDVLEVVGTPNTILETNANNTPGMISPIGDESYKHVIMPMHLG
ncbi:DNA polymerase III subunit beta [Pelolinea submarina]|jgi:DNA polymerase-3 subunit beta|uniref:Beta sliding clamp n=1 Tax=Pelolinea submarina TaxID=913107 RepID=A0A347ZNZ7_9CHLR|nr:DNA polymerase III subunit beta [Pelolinea submarina]REG08630.1 DNA polymerase III beta subunit [Pelolinea submarina]BBB47028.1 DNA polymerase III subunit beta [Pelolinea submarina]